MEQAANGVRVEEFLMVLRNDMLIMVSGSETKKLRILRLQPWRALVVCAVLPVVVKRIEYDSTSCTLWYLPITLHSI